MGILTTLLPLRERTHVLKSLFLGRDVKIRVLLPPYYAVTLLVQYPLVLLNDGQDFESLGLADRLSAAYRQNNLTHRIVVGVEADENRMREYGSLRATGPNGYGDKAKIYSRFVIEELMPFLRKQYRLRQERKHMAIGGFSLGGLSAFDIAWHHETQFGAVGCFSGSFWWRSGPYNPYAPDANRIVIDYISSAPRAADLAYYFMAGTIEEESDRNGNGIIDVIDDTQDVIKGLKSKGIARQRIFWNLVEGGKHDQATWGPQVIHFLTCLDSLP